MSVTFYRILHVAALAWVMASLGGAFIAARLAPGERHAATRLVMISHGVGLLVMLVAGFGMLAKLGIEGIPGWAWAKVALWLLLGGLITVARRAPQAATPAFLALPVLGALGAWLAHAHPF